MGEGWHFNFCASRTTFFKAASISAKDVSRGQHFCHFPAGVWIGNKRLQLNPSRSRWVWRLSIFSCGWPCSTPNRTGVQFGGHPGLTAPAPRADSSWGNKGLWTVTRCAPIMPVPGPWTWSFMPRSPPKWTTTMCYIWGCLWKVCRSFSWYQMQWNGQLHALLIQHTDLCSTSCSSCQLKYTSGLKMLVVPCQALSCQDHLSLVLFSVVAPTSETSFLQRFRLLWPHWLSVRLWRPVFCYQAWVPGFGVKPVSWLRCCFGLLSSWWSVLLLCFYLIFNCY